MQTKQLLSNEQNHFFVGESKASRSNVLVRITDKRRLNSKQVDNHRLLVSYYRQA